VPAEETSARRGGRASGPRLHTPIPCRPNRAVRAACNARWSALSRGQHLRPEASKRQTLISTHPASKCDIESNYCHSRTGESFVPSIQGEIMATIPIRRDEPRRERLLSEVIEERRATPSFDGSPVADEDLRRILEAGTKAPSGYNIQPWRFVVVRSAEG